MGVAVRLLVATRSAGLNAVDPGHHALFVFAALCSCQLSRTNISLGFIQNTGRSSGLACREIETNLNRTLLDSRHRCRLFQDG